MWHETNVQQLLMRFKKIVGVNLEFFMQNGTCISLFAFTAAANFMDGSDLLSSNAAALSTLPACKK